MVRHQEDAAKPTVAGSLAWAALFAVIGFVGLGLIIEIQDNPESRSLSMSLSFFLLALAVNGVFLGGLAYMGFRDSLSSRALGLALLVFWAGNLWGEWLQFYFLDVLHQGEGVTIKCSKPAPQPGDDVVVLVSIHGEKPNALWKITTAELLPGPGAPKKLIAYSKGFSKHVAASKFKGQAQSSTVTAQHVVIPEDYDPTQAVLEVTAAEARLMDDSSKYNTRTRFFRVPFVSHCYNSTSQELIFGETPEETQQKKRLAQERKEQERLAVEQKGCDQALACLAPWIEKWDVSVSEIPLIPRKTTGFALVFTAKALTGMNTPYAGAAFAALARQRIARPEHGKSYSYKPRSPRMFLEDVKNLVSEHHLTSYGVTMGAPEYYGNMFEFYPIEIKVTGSRRDLESFFSDLKGLPYLVLTPPDGFLRKAPG